MKRTKQRTAIGIAVTLGIAVAALVAWRVLACDRSSVDVICSQLDNPGMGHNDFGMTFTVTTTGRAAASALVFEIADTNLEGEPIGESSTYTLTGPFSPGPAIKIFKEDVPAPPHYHPAKFSKLDCTLIHVTFEDGTYW